jgi:hypothetical protein
LRPGSLGHVPDRPDAARSIRIGITTDLAEPDEGRVTSPIAQAVSRRRRANAVSTSSSERTRVDLRN